MFLRFLAVAGVAEMTVSRSSGHPEVAARIRGKVLRTADELGYRPDSQMVRMMA